MAIRWTSKGKEGDPIPWPYRPFCSKCSKHTEIVLNPELGFKGAKTYCFSHTPVDVVDQKLSKHIKAKEKDDVLLVKKRIIEESSLLNKNYTLDG